MDRRSFLSSVVDWLRAGYPQGVPRSDYLPLFALLRRQLTEEEIRQVAQELVDNSARDDSHCEPINRIDVGVEISKITDELPRDEDVARVRHTLETAAWPFDDAPLAPRPDRPGPASAGPDTPEDPS